MRDAHFWKNRWAFIAFLFVAIFCWLATVVSLSPSQWMGFAVVAAGVGAVGSWTVGRAATRGFNGARSPGAAPFVVSGGAPRGERLFWMGGLLAISLATASMTSFIQHAFATYEAAFSRGDRVAFSGPIVDVLPHGPDRVVVVVESGDDPEASSLPRGFRVRLTATWPEIVALSGRTDDMHDAVATSMQHDDTARGHGQREQPSPITRALAWPVALYPFRAPGNPGDFNARFWAMRHGWHASGYVYEEGGGFVDVETMSRGIVPGDLPPWMRADDVAGPCLYLKVLDVIAPATSVKYTLRRWAAAARCMLGARSRNALPFSRSGSNGETTPGNDGGISPGAAISIGMLLGQKDLIDSDLRDRFSRAGIAHLLAVSGLHVGFVLGVITPLLRWLPAAWRWLIVVVSVTVFVALVMGPASAFRAGLTVVVAMGARAMGRPVNEWHQVGFVGTALLVGQPLLITDLGFQLSFLAVIGILLVNDAVGRGQWTSSRLTPGSGRRLPGADAMGLSVLVSVGAHAMTWPLVAGTFSTVSWVSPLANVVAVPAAGVALSLLLVGTVLSLVVAGAGGMVIDAGQYVLDGIVWLADITGPIGAWEIASPPLLVTLGWYAFIVGVAFIVRARRPGVPFWAKAGRRLVVVGVGMVAAAALFTQTMDWLGVVDVWVLDVGQGEAVVIQARGGASAIVDGGGVPGAAATGGFDVGDQIVVPMLKRLGVRQIEAVINTHAHEDHLHGLVAVLQQRRVRRLYGSEGVGTGTAYRHLLQAAEEEGLTLASLQPGDVLPLGRHAALHVLAAGVEAEWVDVPGRAPGLNDLSVATVLVHPGGNMVLLGDMEIRGQQRLLASPSNEFVLPLLSAARVWLVPHHGGHSSLYPPLWDRANPDVAVVSAGEGNRYGHPSEPVLAYMEARDIPLFRTDVHGAVRLRFWPWGVQVSPTRRQ